MYSLYYLYTEAEDYKIDQRSSEIGSKYLQTDVNKHLKSQLCQYDREGGTSRMAVTYFAFQRRGFPRKKWNWDSWHSDLMRKFPCILSTLSGQRQRQPDSQTARAKEREREMLTCNTTHQERRDRSQKNVEFLNSYQRKWPSPFHS